MKSLTEFIDENVNESLATISLLAATTFFSVMMIGGGISAGVNA